MPLSKEFILTRNIVNNANQNMEIIDRRHGYTNEMMVEHCKLLESVMNKTTDIKTGRAPKIQIVKKPKYKSDEATKTKIKESIEYYSKPSFEYRPYQLDIINRGYEIIMDHQFLYLAMEVRTGKTLTSLGIAEKIGINNALFITKKKAISTIQEDYDRLKPNFEMTIINYESLHTVMHDKRWDLIICDEAHSCFLGNTLIDGIKIKDIKVGDYLNSFNFETNKYEKRKVINVYKNELKENLVKIKCNGKEIVCTESHKIFTKRGWVKAGDLLPEDELQVL